MVKVMFSWKDRSDRTAEACEAHYRAVHLPLAREAFDGVDGTPDRWSRGEYRL